MVNRKATAASAKTDSKRKKPRRNTTQSFSWSERDWTVKQLLTPVVSVMVNKEDNKLFVVKKIIRMPSHVEERRSFEARALALLPDCNRIARPLVDLAMGPDEDHATIIFEHYPLGDLKQWKLHNFDERNNKPVTESFIWRCFIQMSQALAFIHNSIGPDPDEKRYCLLHRDIKPENILVVNNGTTYPSFLLHDFGCARIYIESRADEPSYCGTYKWQPPENPRINTAEADIWALGACIHFLAVGRAPVEDVGIFAKDFRELLGREDFKEPSSLMDYKSTDRYFGARVPRQVIPVNLSQKEQLERGLGPEYYQYSDDLHEWMSQCLRFEPEERPSAIDLLEEMVDVGKEMLHSMGGQAALGDLEITFGIKA